MKKKNAILSIILIIAVLFIGYRVYDAAFPFAKPLEPFTDYPDVGDVLTVTISTPDGESTGVYGFASLIMQIQQVEPTRKASVNDTPSAEFYYKVAVATESKAYNYFIYEEKGQVYLEIPYLGIYKGQYNTGSSSLMEIIPDLIANYPAG